MKDLSSIIGGIRKSCERFGVKRLEVFGSVARNEATDSSDIDFLVEFLDLNKPHISDQYFGLLEDLERQCERPVDLIEASSVSNPYFKMGIDRNRVVIYGN